MLICSHHSCGCKLKKSVDHNDNFCIKLDFSHNPSINLTSQSINSNNYITLSYHYLSHPSNQTPQINREPIYLREEFDEDLTLRMF